jgi:hypothetical protein
MFFVHEHKISKAMSKPPAPTYHQTPINDPKLMVYLAIDRAIPAKVWQNVPELSQIIYCPMGARYDIRYSNIAFRNDSGGFELRNREFKGSLAPKTITTIPGTGNDLNLFEGFFDYMSALVYFKTPRLKNTTIILNSLANIKKARPAIEKAELINLFLDNDPAGTGAANNLQAMFGNCINRSLELYPDFHDFNDLVKARSL